MLYEVITRMAGDPPDIYVAPRLGQMGLLDYDRAEDAIHEGRISMERALPQLQDILQRSDAGAP